MVFEKEFLGASDRSFENDGIFFYFSLFFLLSPIFENYATHSSKRNRNSFEVDSISFEQNVH